jgi:hypothetical protein
MTFFEHGNDPVRKQPIMQLTLNRWYNTTYIVFAASVLLLHLLRFRETTPFELQQTNIQVVEMAVELLEAMDESVVAKRAAELTKQSLSVVKKSSGGERPPAPIPAPCFEDPHLHSFMLPTLEQEFDDTVSV